VVTDPAEVRRLSELKAAENLDFQRHLRAHHTPESTFHIIAERIESEFDCQACANCCRETLVTVSANEAHAIAQFLSMEDAEVIRLYTLPGAEPGEGRVLRNEPNGCIFLDGNLCTVYSVRPKVCREFPHLRGHEDTLPHRMSATIRRASICPIVYNALEEYKHLVGFHARGHHA
jgi:uncharacterized protein